MRIIALKTIREFWEKPRFADSEQPLKSWYAIAKRADWSGPADIKQQFGQASFIHGNKVVFNIAGNKYRLVVRFNYSYRIGYIRFVGTHAQYDALDMETL